MDTLSTTRTSAKQILNKVPEITIYFWIIKIMCTTVGETAADFLNFNLGVGLTNTTYIMGVLLAAVLFVQFRLRRYMPAVYWLAVVLLSIVGTLITDNLSDNFKIPLVTTTIIFSVALSCVFGLWYASEKTLSIHSITTVKREAFYWLTILFTFALGTAGGDLLSEKINLGYLISGLLFAGAIAIITVAHLRFKLPAVVSFWAAYIITRPLGASIGDLLSQPTGVGGLNINATLINTLFLLTIFGLITYLGITKKDAPRTSL